MNARLSHGTSVARSAPGWAQGLLIAFALAMLATTSVSSVRHAAHGPATVTDPLRIDPIDHSLWMD
jgi:hypothetical protein